MQKSVQVEKWEHSPTLNTVLMVEDSLKNANESVLSVAELKRRLPKQVNHYTLKKILEYLEESSKIAFSAKGVTWIHNSNLRLQKEIATIRNYNGSKHKTYNKKMGYKN